MFFLTINTKESLTNNILLLDEFEKEIYIPNFPNENEREPFFNIKKRIEENGYPKTNIILLIDNDKVIGGCVSDYYPECNSLEIIYLVIDKLYRGNGYGKLLLNESITLYNNPHVFLEIDNPEQILNTDWITIDPLQRFNMYLKWGFNVLKFNYIQPPLSSNGTCEENLLLLYKGPGLNKDVLKDFLYCFYKGLNYENSEELKSMFKDIETLF